MCAVDHATGIAAVVTNKNVLKLNLMGIPLGVGGQLKQLFRWFFINARPECPCNKHAAQMDRWGPDGCEQNMDTILGWLETEASARHMPFSKTIAERLVRICIWRARRQK